MVSRGSLQPQLSHDSATQKDNDIFRSVTKEYEAQVGGATSDGSKLITSPKHLTGLGEGRSKEAPTYSTQPGKELSDLKAEDMEKY